MNAKKSAILTVFCLFLSMIDFYASDGSMLERGAPIPPGFSELSFRTNPDRIWAFFTHGDARIAMEVQRGEPTPAAVLESSPEAPPYAMDIRLMDEAGTPFFIQIGGDRLIDTSWMYSSDAVHRLRPEARATWGKTNFTAALKMLEKIKSLRFRAGFIPEQDAILGILPLLEEALASGAAKKEVEDIPPDTTGCTDIHEIEIWKQPLLTYAEHSGTLAKVISSGTTYQVWSACNHGSCPGGYDMHPSCSRSFPNRCPAELMPPYCATYYGASTGEHVCNDDSHIQYERIRNDLEPDIYGGTCADDFLRKFAPDCW